MTISIKVGDALASLRAMPSDSVHCVVTSPPYWGLRDYGTPPQVWGGSANCRHRWGGERTAARHTQGAFCARCGAWRGSLGLEPTYQLYVEHLVAVLREVRRVLRRDGTLWLNLGDCYATGAGKAKRAGGGAQGERWQGPPGTQPNRIAQPGLKPKDLTGIPWRVAFALQDDGWWLRRDHVWSKPNPMPESVRDRCTSAHEYLFLLTKAELYYYDAEAVKEPAVSFGRQETTGIQPPKVRALQDDGHHGKGGDLSINYERRTRNKRSVWTIATAPFPGAHFATFPPLLVEPCILAGTSERGVCSHCGAPWRRLVKRAEPIGWRASCDCPGTDPVPAIVLDPFLGAGTTALVADRLGRDCVGLELSRSYAKMAARRAAKERTAPQSLAPSSQQPARPASSHKGGPDATREGRGGQISSARRGPLPRQAHAQKIFFHESCGLNFGK
jgi:DNA modification methylase